MVGEDLSPTHQLIEELDDPTFEELINELATRIDGMGTLPSTVAFAATAASVEESLLFIGDIVVAALAELDALPLGYQATMNNLRGGLTLIRLRAIYDAAVQIGGGQ